MKHLLFSLSALLLIACGPDTTSSTLLPPQLQADGTYRWQNGPLDLTVSPEQGGRLMSYQWQEQELLVQPGEDPWAFGSTCWPAPHNWGWPPPPEIDAQPFEAQLLGDTLRLQGPLIPKLGLQIERLVWVETATHRLHQRYLIYNRSDSVQSVAAWEVTRQPKGGTARCHIDTTAFPYQSLDGLEQQQLTADGKYEVHLPTGYNGRAQKVSFDGAEGWISYEYGGVRLRKQAPDIDISQFGPKGGELEIYLDDNSNYVEIEIQGPYQALKPGEAAVLQTHWEVE